MLQDSGKAIESNSYMWLYRTGREGPSIVLYDYQPNRSGAHPKRFLEGFDGYLQTDGYSGYKGLTNITLIGCMAHARRYFDEAIKAMPVNMRNEPSTAREGLNFCNKLFAIERDLEGATPEERFEGRIKFSRPVLDDFKKWIRYQLPRVMPKSALGKALTYCCNQWEYLEGFMKDGRLELSNNRGERSIKPYVMGRKAWLFSNTPRGAYSSAVVYSIVETAKENGLKPFEYLNFLFEMLPNIDVIDDKALDNLLPWSAGVPDSCRLK